MKKDIFIVTVVYNSHVCDSLALRSCLKIMHISRENIYIIDNSCADYLCDNSKFCFQNHIKYIAMNNNCGLASAYNVALERISKMNSRGYLLLLDQDTSFNEEYYLCCAGSLSSNVESSVVAYVPHAYCRGRKVSPWRWNKRVTMKSKYLPSDMSGACYEIAAINSCSLISIEYLNSIGGFDQRFFLDSLDFWLYAKIAQDKKKVYVMDVVVEQNLSVFDFYRCVSPERYESIIKSEKLFFGIYGSPMRKMLHQLKLLAKVVQFVLKGKSAYALKAAKVFISYYGINYDK